MREFIIRRIMQMIIVMVAVSIISFIIIELPPGDYLTTLRAELEQQQWSEDQIQATLQVYAERYGLDKPWYGRYWYWISSILRGDLGYSMMMGNRVDVLIGDRLH